MAASSGPLAGLRIVEFDALGPVPMCAMLLADQGAEVIRIARADAPAIDHSVGGAILHRNRTMIGLDLKRDKDRDQALALIGEADGLIEGFRPGVMERLGLGPGICQARNPRLVYARMTGWGQTGPLAPRAGHDINYIALTGLLNAIGPADEPIPPLNVVGDYAGGAMFLAFGMLAGLHEARRTGQGRVVDVAMCDAVPVLMSLFHAFAQSGAWHEKRQSNLLDGGAPFYRCYTCREGGHMAVGPLEPQFYAQLMTGLGLPVEDHPQYDTAAWPRIEQAMSQAFATRSRAEWTEIFQDMDACVSPVLTMTEARQAPHLAARGVFIRRGDLVEAAPAPRFSGIEATIRAPSAATAAEILRRWISDQD